MKFVFTGGNLGTTIKNGEEYPVCFVVEYNPRKADYLCPRLEATVVDTPASTLKERPGYEAELKIYNPNHDILAVIASGMNYINATTDVISYYKNKVRVSVYAGYYTHVISTLGPQSLSEEEKMPEGQKEENITIKKEMAVLQDTATYGTPIFSGYVNNSLLVHQGTDTILTLACHDIDMTANQFNQIKMGLRNARELPSFPAEVDDKRYKPNQNTFDASFRWLVSHLSTDYYPSNLRGKEMSSIKMPIPDNYNRNSLNPGWFKVFYVSSLSAFESAASTLEGLESDRSFWDEALRYQAEDPYSKISSRTKGFYTLKSYVEDALNELCSASGEYLGCQHYDLFGYTVYCIYRRGNRSNTVSLNTKGVIKVINFQNLLNTPAVTPTGSLKIDMLFNRDCKTWKYIALVLESGVNGNQEETGLLNINKLNFFKPEGMNEYVVPLGGTARNAAVATTQLSTSMQVAAAAHFNKVAAKNGYMFNTGFLMVKVIHKLATHSKNWSTTVQTVPMMLGVKEE